MPYKPTGRPPGRPRHQLLTPAELRVLDQLRRGLTNAEIAEALGTSLDAVKYHVSNMLGKLGFENREELAAWRQPPGPSWLSRGLLVKLGLAAGAVAATGAATVALVLFRAGDEEGTVAGELMTGLITAGFDGRPIDGTATNPAISADGRFVAFESDATNLVPGDTNGKWDVFVFDRGTATMRRVSVPRPGVEADGDSHNAAISADGRFVAFDSVASNLVPGDNNGDLDRARAVIPDGALPLLDATRGPNAVGQIQSQVASDVFVVELRTGTVELISKASTGEQGNLGSFNPSISADGRLVAFESSAPNLAGRAQARMSPPAGFSWLLAADIYVHDREARETTLVSKHADGSLPAFGSGYPVVSADGSRVAFVSRESSLAGIPGGQAFAFYLWSRDTGRLSLIPLPAAPPQSDGVLFVEAGFRLALSRDGRLAAYGLQASAPVRPQPEGIPVSGVYLYREGAPAPSQVPGSESPSRADASVSLTADGRTLVFLGGATGTGPFAMDIPGGTVTPLPLPVPALRVAIAGDGRSIVVVHPANDVSATGGRSGLPRFEISVFAH